MPIKHTPFMSEPAKFEHASVLISISSLWPIGYSSVSLSSLDSVVLTSF